MITALCFALILQGKPQAEVFPVEMKKDRTPSVVTNGSCLIKGGHVFTVTGPEYPSADVLIEGGKIKAIGPNLIAPIGVTVIDAKGKFVTPGLIDAHSHMAMDESNEWTDAVTPEVKVSDILDPDSDTFYEKLSAGTTSALVLHGSANPIGGQSQIIKLRWKHPVSEVLFAGAPRVVKFALGENVKQSNDNLSPTRFPYTRMGVEAVYRRAFTAARDYMQVWDRYMDLRKTDPGAAPPRRDLRLEALADILRGKIIVHCHAYRADEMLMLARLSKEFGFKLVCFQHALEAYKIAPELAEAGIGVSCFTDAWAYKMEVYDSMVYNVALCVKAGVLASVNSDTFGGPASLMVDAAKTITYGGLSPEEAMKLVTINPAKQLLIDKYVGSLEVGKDGDIAIWDGHPQSTFSRCAMTLIDGNVYFQRRDAWGVDKSAATADTLPVPGNNQPALVPETASVVAIVGGRVHPVSGPVIENGIVVLRDGKIEAVGANLQIPSDAAVFHADGLDVWPGLIDCFTDVGRTEVGSVASTNDNSELGVFQPDLIALHAVNPESELIPVTRLGGITSVFDVDSGPVIAGQGSLMNLAGFTWEQMGIKPKAALSVTFPNGLDAIPFATRENMTDEALAQAKRGFVDQVERIKDYFGKAKRYGLARKEDPEHTPIDERVEAMQPYVTGQLPVVISCGTADSIKAAVAFAEEFGLRMILRSGREPWREGMLLAAKKIPVIVAPPELTSIAAEANNPARSYDPYDSKFAAAELLHRMGVKFCFSSDSAAMGYDLARRVGRSCAFGLPPDVAMRALTLNAAEIFGVQDQLGSLERGKIGNIIVTEGNPLESTTPLRGLFINGRCIPLVSKWTRLYEKYKTRIPSLR